MPVQLNENTTTAASVEDCKHKKLMGDCCSCQKKILAILPAGIKVSFDECTHKMKTGTCSICATNGFSPLKTAGGRIATRTIS